MPFQSVPIDPVDEVDIKYTLRGLYLSVAPVWAEKDVSGVCAIRSVPYRVLSDGTIDKREDLATSISFSDIFKEAEQDAVFGAAFSSIFGALAIYIASKEI